MGEWTPRPEEIAQDGHYCGMKGPPQPQRSSPVDVNFATTFIERDGEDRCNIVMGGSTDFKISRRFVPDRILWKFLAMNSKVLAQNICACLLDPGGRGYEARIQADVQGFYEQVRRRAAEEPSSS